MLMLLFLASFLPPQPTSLLAQYISYARTYVHPVISEAAGIDIIDFYVKMRNPESRKNNNTISFTTRQLESTIRLAEAHARMSLSPVITRENVREANRSCYSLTKLLNSV